nr:family 43 glycosylhydrolase [Pseudarcicella sp.]
MRKIFITLLSVCICYFSLAQKKSPISDINVILSGDYADPSILKDGADYYMTNTSTNFSPGLRVWHSKDLLNWKPIGYALKTYVGEVWAPDFVKHGDTYYIYFPAYPGTNWVVTAKSPYGPWSEPIDLKVKGIDPGHIATPDGKRYLYFNGGMIAELNPDGISLKEEPRKVYDGWQYPKDWSVECFCAESPKINYTNGYYYLTTAQGGTSGPSTSHMVVQARAKSPLGPWENSPINPIVHTYSEKEKYWSKGHGTIVKTPDNGWAVVYHAYEKNNLSHGRQVLLEPLEYTKDGWFKTVRNKKIEPNNINIIDNLKTVSDDFSGNKMNDQWQKSENYSNDNYFIKNGFLELKSNNDSLKVLHITTENSNYEATIKFQDIKGLDVGLVAFYRENNMAGINFNGEKISRVGATLKYGSPSIKNNNAKYLKITVKNFDLTMKFSSDGINWETYPNSMNIQGYQHNVFGKFSALKPA